jgi:hypothetical protein
MLLPPRNLLQQAFSCWNWKCALMSATARSLVYLAGMSRKGFQGSLAVVLVEIAYVTLTAGAYAGMQQRALTVRPRLVGSLIITVGVPALSQALDWTAHRVTGATVTGKATLAVCLFAGVSALIHLHLMRRGAFLTGIGTSLADDFRNLLTTAARPDFS